MGGKKMDKSVEQFSNSTQGNHTKEKPSVHTRGEVQTTNQVQAIKVETCAARAKTTKRSAEKIVRMQPDKPKGTSKTQGKKTTPDETPQAESQVDLPEDIAEAKPLTKKTTRATKKIAKPKEEQQPEAPEDSKEATVDSVLHTTLKNLRIKRDERSTAANAVNEIIKNITKHLKKNSQSFKEVQDPLPTGSYYENLKISRPDEFDIMLPVLVERVQIEAFGDDGAFYSVALKRGKNPLLKFQENDILSGSKMLAEFRDEVKKCVKEYKEWRVDRKKKGCPAVTLTTKVESINISLDVVLCLMVKSSWPAFTNEGFKIEGWLGRKVKQEYKRQPYYLVPKYEGCGRAEKDGVQAKDAWRVSFSHIEKAMVKNHGSEKTCCEKGGASCCRKDCLKLLKHLLTLLKEEDSSLDKFCSYHAKTTFLHACCSRTKDSEWSATNLSHCFQLLLEDLEGHLEKGVLNNFFIPSQNLLLRPSNKVCMALASCIKEERHNGFPIFKQCHKLMTEL
ncbi:cyclic GMP-AMP synthase [Parambassis ranga]|uniref:Cyclic GMP-AMP synthase n=1 Tax=Parambassis ranga TaxID=210632 RepID=A0A6P7JUT7_9TELE|nr:cyclic GMP-AMP synthase-like [Parambassis ranga]